MISFKQLCELETNNQRHSWFTFDPKLLQYLSPQDLSLVHMDISRDGVLRLWYPKEKYLQDHFHRTRTKDSGQSLSIKKQSKQVNIDKLLKQAMYKALTKNI